MALKSFSFYSQMAARSCPQPSRHLLFLPAQIRCFPGSAGAPDAAPLQGKHWITVNEGFVPDVCKARGVYALCLGAQGHPGSHWQVWRGCTGGFVLSGLTLLLLWGGCRGMMLPQNHAHHSKPKLSTQRTLAGWGQHPCGEQGHHLDLLSEFWGSGSLVPSSVPG